ncbi:MAG: sigma-70 family RNA polymerase sigma factor [Cyanobacteria bacterium Co-bin13]|nr:sigma-70 family RNA polymerase sigma factor [Cyanobacteria bacterium Co-bin13]
MHSEPPSSHADLNPTDVELCLALRAGQTEALGALYDRHAGLVYGLALRLLGNAQEAEDLTQDIFLNLAKTQSFDPRRGSLRTYLAILTRSRAVDRMRSHRSAHTHLQRWQRSNDPLVTKDSPFDVVAEQEQSQEIRSALTQLSQEQQQVLRLAYYDGLTQSQIAAQLNLPLGTVKARSRRALLKLRQTLQDDPE